MAGPTTARMRVFMEPGAPDSLAAWMWRYLAHLESLQRSVADVRTRRTRLAMFQVWCKDRGLEAPQDIIHRHLEQFQQWLFRYRKKNGQPLSINGQRITLFTLEMFFRYLVKQGVVQSNPASDLELPRRTMDLRDPLTLEEMETVLALPELETAHGLRDRACLELFYATGIRRAELCGLRVDDLDRSRGTLHVRLGKGRKDRFVPLGERALAWIDKYLDDARPQLAIKPGERHLFLNHDGEPLSQDGLTARVRRYFREAGITKVGACHLFRHTMATAMLDNGADIRHVQEMLGHSAIATTQRYTHVSIARLKAVHAATHPAARLTRSSSPDPED